MEISVVIEDDSTKVKFKDGNKTLELSRKQLEMGLRFLNAADPGQQMAMPPIITHNHPVVQTTVQQDVAPHIPSVPIAQSSNSFNQESKNIAKPVPNKPVLDVKKANDFLKEVANQNKKLEEEGNAKAVGTEMPIRRAILKLKDRVNYETMAKATEIKLGIPLDRFDKLTCIE